MTVPALAAGLLVAVVASDPFEIEVIQRDVGVEIIVEIEVNEVGQIIDSDPFQIPYAAVFTFEVKAGCFAAQPAVVIRITGEPMSHSPSAFRCNSSGEAARKIAEVIFPINFAKVIVELHAH